ncbi:hypothetical protein [uncultured Mucilaginibacter sp.]|uniref:hypothetical protein n=1 Tax=uncultured Mucilaginibacter sp. TaxID=797541 RepID=UPI0025E2BD19|nr:hypothetical protein [uncultured Mucilaginibacter sp.]
MQSGKPYVKKALMVPGTQDGDTGDADEKDDAQFGSKNLLSANYLATDLKVLPTVLQARKYSLFVPVSFSAFHLVVPTPPPNA